MMLIVHNDAGQVEDPQHHSLLTVTKQQGSSRYAVLKRAVDQGWRVCVDFIEDDTATESGSSTLTVNEYFQVCALGSSSDCVSGTKIVSEGT